MRYEDRTHLTPLRDIRHDSWVLIQGKILKVNTLGKGKKRCLVTLADSSGTIELVFFHFYPSQQMAWQPGVSLRCFGQVKSASMYQIIHPEYEIIDNAQPLPAYLTPVYPTVLGLGQAVLRKVMNEALNHYLSTTAPDVFAQKLERLLPLLNWHKALQTIHGPFPDDNIEALVARQHPAFKRLIAEELFAHHLGLKQIKQQVETQQASVLSLSEEILHTFLARLSFNLTPAQQKVWEQIRADIESYKPMLRLVQGDVGCGKTVVAALGAFAAVVSGKQVAVMVPTEILAGQHAAQFNEWFNALGYRCEILSGKLKAKARRSVQENITLGLTHIVIGTHALFQEEIQFKSLGLVIIDEQHRFGVHQRLALQIKGSDALEPTYPHQLIMTATPIPRTLVMSHYAHLDVSIIDSLPPGRQPITTLAISQSRREEIIERVKNVCAQKQQVYWVCTLIQESEILDCQAAEATTQILQSMLPQYRVGLVHGKMDALTKESVMHDFHQGHIHILVATTVIEVGVNVPNASLMVIENPERLGLAQLHQLRGRVGRGTQASFCVLLYQTPLSAMARARLKIMRETQDGFVIAQADLELRGPGEILGTRQTGAIQFKVADLQRDKALIHALPEWELQLPQDAREAILARWCGIKQEYAKA